MTESKAAPPEKWVLNKRYLVFGSASLGAGAFGTIYKAVDLFSADDFAVKLEKEDVIQPQLPMEARLYSVMKNTSHVPKMEYFGSQDGFNALVMGLMGPSLEELFVRCRRTFCLRTVCFLMLQLLDRVESIHQHCFVHRDLKPDNFVIGRGQEENKVFLIDLGLCKRYCDTKTRVHVPFRDKKGLTGTIRYVSVNTHKGIEQTRRDDLESLGYMMIYFMNGSLPWMGVRAQNRKTKYQRIGEIKARTSIEELCKYQPEEFVSYFKYVRGLAYDEDPNYSYLRRLFKDLLRKEGYEMNGIFEWHGGGVIRLPGSLYPGKEYRIFVPSPMEAQRMILRKKEKERLHDDLVKEQQAEKRKIEAYLRLHPHSANAKEALKQLSTPIRFTPEGDLVARGEVAFKLPTEELEIELYGFKKWEEAIGAKIERVPRKSDDDLWWKNERALQDRQIRQPQFAHQDGGQSEDSEELESHDRRSSAMIQGMSERYQKDLERLGLGSAKESGEKMFNDTQMGALLDSIASSVEESVEQEEIIAELRRVPSDPETEIHHNTADSKGSDDEKSESERGDDLKEEDLLMIAMLTKDQTKHTNLATASGNSENQTTPTERIQELLLFEEKNT